MLVYSTGIFAIILGGIFFLDAENFVSNPTFAYSFAFAKPQVWGAVMAITAVLMMFGFWTGRTAGRAPAFVLAMMFSVLGITAAREPLANPDGPSLLSASAVYTFVGIICGLCIFACSARTGVERAEAADDHVHH